MAGLAPRESASLYAVLEVASDASTTDIRAAYKRRALRSHPDKGGDAELFRSVVRAFEVLSSSRLRGLYDAQLRRRRQREAPRAAAPRAQAQAAAAPPRAAPREPAPPGGTASPCGGHGEARGGQEERSRGRARVLQLRLRRLRRLLGRCAAQSRRQAIEAMSPGLQRALVAFMEQGDARPEPRGRDPLALRPGRPCRAAASSDGEASGALASDALDDVAPWAAQLCVGDGGAGESSPPPCPGPRRGSSGSQEAGGARGKRRGINEVRDRSGSTRYDARISFRNLTLASRLTRSLEEAVHCHMGLTLVRQRTHEIEDELFLASAHGGPQTLSEAASQFARALKQALGEVPELQAFGLSFQVQLDARNWVGRMVSSPRIFSAEEVMDAWCRLESARCGGWAELRALWSSWLQKDRRARWGIHTRSARQAEDFIAAAEAGFAATRARLEAFRAGREARRRQLAEASARRRRRREERAARCSERERERARLLRDLWLPRAVAFAEQAVQQQAARAAREQAAAGRRRSAQRQRATRAAEARLRQGRRRAELERRRAKWRWLHRGDLTMEEIRRGFPG